MIPWVAATSASIRPATCHTSMTPTDACCSRRISEEFMTRSIPRFFLLLCFAALPAAAQPVKAFVDGKVLQPDEPRTALATACDGEWLNVRRAILSGGKLDAQLRTPAGQQRALCLLRAIDEQPKADMLLVQGDVDEFVAAYGIESLDFFAAHADEMSARVSRATWNALLGYAQPDAMTRYFARHRQTMSLPAHGGSGAVGFYQPLLAGRCMESVCSP